MYNLLDSLLFGHVSLHIQTTLFYLCKAYLLPYWNGKTFQWKFHKSQFIIRYHLQLDIIYLLNGLQTILLWVKVKSLSRVPPTLCDPMDYTVHGILQARILEWVAIPFSRGFSRPWDRTCVSFIAARFFSTEPPGKPSVVSSRQKSESESSSVVSDSLWPRGLYSPWNPPGQNTGVGSISLLQGIFLTQGSNPGLPHCRQIPYQLSPQWSPAGRKALQMPLLRRAADLNVEGVEGGGRGGLGRKKESPRT